MILLYSGILILDVVCDTNFPTVAHGAFATTTMPPFQLADTITLMCMYGYWLQTDDYSVNYTCLEDGAWHLDLDWRLIENPICTGDWKYMRAEYFFTISVFYNVYNIEM